MPSQRKKDKAKLEEQRKQLELELRTLLLDVADARNMFSWRGEQMMASTEVLAIENSELHERCNEQSESIKEREDEASQLRSQLEALREELERLESKAGEASQVVSAIKSQTQQDAERQRHEERRMEAVLQSERADRFALESLRHKLERDLHAAQVKSQEASKRQAESSASMMKLREMELRVKMESEVAEARREVALVRAEFNSEHSFNFPSGRRETIGKMRSSSSHGDAPSLERSLVERERELAQCKSELRTAEHLAAVAKERAQASSEECLKARTEYSASSQAMLAERDKNRRLEQVLTQRETELHVLRQQLAAARDGMELIYPSEDPLGTEAQIRKAHALERQLERLERRIQGIDASPGNNNAPSPIHQFPWSTVELPGRGGDEAAGICQAAARNRPGKVTVTVTRADGSKDDVVVNSLQSMAETPDRTASRLERLHARLKGMTADPGMHNEFDMFMRR